VSTFPYVYRELMRAARDGAASTFVLSFALIFVTLFAFSAFFLLAPTSDDLEPVGWGTGSFIVHLVATATTDEAQAVYTAVRSIDDVVQINYVFGEELEPQQIAGAFLVRVNGASFDSAREETSRLAAVAAVDAVDEPVSVHKASVPLTARAVLLVLLVLGIVGTLVASRFAFRRLLGAFSSELRLLHLAGAPDTTVLIPVFVIGVLGGVAAILVVVLVASLLRIAAIAGPDGALAASTLLADRGRVVAVLLLNLPVGIVIGSLAGAVGVGLAVATRADTD